MDEHPAHWENTLMGSDFWYDAAEYQDQLSQDVEPPPNPPSSAPDPSLHIRFPFNLVPERNPRSQQETTNPKRRRRLSVSDIRPSTGLRRPASISRAPSRLRDLGRLGRSLSPRKRSAPVTPAFPWTPLPALLPDKEPENLKGSIIKAVEVPVSPPVTPTTNAPIYNPGRASPKKPLMNFRGGFAWETLSQDRTSLGLDMFRPQASDQKGLKCLSIVEMKPLCQFRGLRSLKLVGMMQSYQTYIWQAAWLNLNLEELELGMALEPEVTSLTYSMQWKLIQHGWEMDPKNSGDPVYYGDRGDGELHPKIGHGEYLDKQSIEKAKIRALAMGATSKQLTIKKLTLSGFVVDADPFIHWFDPDKLRSIHFKGECVDAGFWLPASMEKVSIRVPRPIDLEAVPVGILKINPRKDLDVKGMKGGEVVKEDLRG